MTRGSALGMWVPARGTPKVSGFPLAFMRKSAMRIDLLTFWFPRPFVVAPKDGDTSYSWVPFQVTEKVSRTHLSWPF